MRAAKRLLADTEAPLTEIALELGCGSLQSVQRAVSATHERIAERVPHAGNTLTHQLFDA